MVEETIEERLHGRVVPAACPSLRPACSTSGWLSAFVAAHDELEQFFSSGVRQLAHPQVVHDE